MSKAERQRSIESDSVRDGCVRWAQHLDYQQATDTKPYRNMLGISWRSLADAIGAEQDRLQTGKTKLPPYALALLSVGHEQQVPIVISACCSIRV